MHKNKWKYITPEASELYIVTHEVAWLKVVNYTSICTYIWISAVHALRLHQIAPTAKQVLSAQPHIWYGAEATM